MTRAGLALVVVAAAAACSPDLGEPGRWTSLDRLAGAFRAEAGGAPVPAAMTPLPGGRLRVVTFNVHEAADPAALAEALGSHPDLALADILLLQEVEQHPGEGGSRAARLAGALGLGWVYVPARLAGDGTHGLAILSAHPIEQVEVMRLPRSDVSQPRIAVRADILVGDRILHLIDTHLGATLNVTDRILQLRPAIIEGPESLLVAGDFNTSPYMWGSGAVPVLPVGAVSDTDQAPIIDDYMRELGFAAPTAGLGPTEHMLGVEARLDSIYCRGMAATPGGVARDIDLSDHWPVWIDIDLD